ncbi:HTH-type transcriptional activator CmpR [Nymphon striatum]|nr:HTH-type transcriptional activator CmpR [Nymphon striatum]
MHLSQPAMSIQIKRLEESVGLPLVDKVGMKIYLTEAGKELAETTLDVLDRLDNVEPNLTITNQATVIQRLEENIDDLVVMGRKPNHLELESQEFLENPLVLIAPINHPLAQEKNISLERIATERFISRELGSGTREALRHLFSEHELEVKPYMELGSAEAIKQAVMVGLGVSIMSLHNLQLELEVNKLTILDIKHFPLQRKWYVSAHGKPLASLDPEFPFVMTNFESMNESAQADYPHRHDCYEILYICEGEGTHIIDFEPYTVKPNTFYFLSKDQVHFWQLKSHAKTTSPIARQFSQLVSEHFISEHSVKDYANKIGISTSHLTDTIKAVTGQSPGNIIRQKLAVEAKRLLVQSNASIAEIGSAVYAETDTKQDSKTYKIATRLSDYTRPITFTPTKAIPVNGAITENVVTTTQNILNKEAHFLKKGIVKPVGEDQFSAWELVSDEGGSDHSLKFDDPMTKKWSGFTDKVISNILIKSNESPEKITALKEMAFKAWAVGEGLANKTTIDAAIVINSDNWSGMTVHAGKVESPISIDNGFTLTNVTPDLTFETMEVEEDLAFGMMNMPNPMIFPEIAIAESAYDAGRPYMIINSKLSNMGAIRR